MNIENSFAEIRPAALLVHVPDIEAGLAWYRQAFPQAKLRYLPEFDFTILDVGEFSLEIVRADDKVGAGKNGTVMYWLVPDLDTAIDHLTRLGGKLYRGPLPIENGLIMCQIEDPFGNLIGLRGM